MQSLAEPLADRARWLVPLVFAVGLILLLAAWALLYWSESLFTESHLVGYYCCVTERELPEPGTLERTMSDFFKASPGKHLPSLLFVGANLALFALSLRRERRLIWWLPWLFVVLIILYVWADFRLMVLSWTLSNTFVGLPRSTYAGYERTWYGIVLHLLLWAVYLAALALLLRKLLSRSPAAEKAAIRTPVTDQEADT